VKSPIQRTLERRAVRMQQMMHRLDVDALALVRLRNGEAYAEARTKCMVCDEGHECLRWLDEGGMETRGPDFCPNLGYFNSCRQLPYLSLSPRFWQIAKAVRKK